MCIKPVLVSLYSWCIYNDNHDNDKYTGESRTTPIWIRRKTHSRGTCILPCISLCNRKSSHSYGMITRLTTLQDDILYTNDSGESRNWQTGGGGATFYNNLYTPQDGTTECPRQVWATTPPTQVYWCGMTSTKLIMNNLIKHSKIGF